MSNAVYQVTTDKSFTEAVEALQAQTPTHAFRVLHIHDYQTILAEKGFTRGPLKIIEICHAQYAHETLQQEALFSLVMPCRISVYTEGEKTVINTLRPTALLEMFEKPELQETAEQVEKIMIEIINSSK